MASTPASRRQPAEPQPRLAPAFDRDALALSYLHERGHLNREEFRDNLRMLGVKLNDEEPRRLPVPRVAHIEPPAKVLEREPPPEDDEEALDPWFDENEES